ncbi:MAG: ribonuclease HII, partial [Candidatus Diapherotrites archaeon]|nr:ribonuclease HII [Candidatus Diapherotrites archaeon]
MIVAGIDEAGRGPVFGSLVMAVAVVEKSTEEYFKQIGVKDSKVIAPGKRESLFSEIESKALEYLIIEITVPELNDLMTRFSLNEIEAMYAAKLLNKLKNKPDRVYVDSPDAIPLNFKARIEKYLDTPLDLVSENGADAKYVSCSAASVLAKVSRDRHIESLKKKWGNLGSGYPSDPQTKAFLKKWVEVNNSL